MNLNASRTRLQLLTREILLRFDETKTSWRDARADEFERKYMQELLARVEKSVGSVEKLDQVLSKVKNDCE